MKPIILYLASLALTGWAAPVDRSPLAGIDDAIVAPTIPAMLPFEAPADSSTKPGDPQPILDRLVVGCWWEDVQLLPEGRRQFWTQSMEQFAKKRFFDQPRSERIAFVLYTTDSSILKMTVQMLPLLPDEPRELVLEIRPANKQKSSWKPIANTHVLYPGWTAHFRVEQWDDTQAWAYRVRSGKDACFEGIVRSAPLRQDEISIAVLSCNASSNRHGRPQYVEKLKTHNPDMLFFAGDQHYDHEEHTIGWLTFGYQFRDVMRDRPTITIPDDHDVGHGNLWGVGGGQRARRQGADDGGYKRPPSYVRMVERAQTWHLPDAYHTEKTGLGLNTYYTRMRLGWLDCAILEDRKWKSAPAMVFPERIGRTDHVRDDTPIAELDPAGTEMLGKRQEEFLSEWGQDWEGALAKVVLSQTAFCGSVHYHGKYGQRLRADLDSNAWPASGRNRALRLIRAAGASHLCGDQHIAVMVKHGIDEPGDGPYAFTSPAIVNTIYRRWWWPESEMAGPDPVKDSPLPFTGDYEDGLGNKIRMLAYANVLPNTSIEDDPDALAEGFGIARFSRIDRTTTVECWKRYADEQFPGWPVHFKWADNDGRKPSGFITLPTDCPPVVQVVNKSTGDILYTRRLMSETRKLPVYGEGPFMLKAGKNRPDKVIENTAP